MFETSNNYMHLDAWILANIIQLATYDFCRRFLKQYFEPSGRQFDQMTQAARSGQANIAEGVARGKTSKETEMKLLDVARASLAELSSDFTYLLMIRNEIPWQRESAEAKEVIATILDPAAYGNDWTGDSCRHILRQKAKFDRWLKSQDLTIAANASLILIARCINAINHLLEKIGKDFKNSGGFSEALARARNEARDAEAIAAGAPRCPLCNSVMRRCLAKRGPSAGSYFWSCSRYPVCTATLPDNHA